MAELPGFQQLCAELVRCPSVSSENAPHDTSNRAVVDVLAGWLDGLGYACEVMPVAGLAGRPGKFNLIAARGRGAGGLVLSGHTDTVPFDDDRWHSDPFELIERDGALVGLGVCDMKGFLAMAVQIAAEYKDRDLKQPLILVGTADEESTMAGARALVAAGRPKARYAVIGEPTGLRPVRLHKGILMDSLRVIGESAHSSRPDLGANAIEGMHEVLEALIKYREQIKSRGRAPEFALPYATMNFGCIHGGDSANRVASQCELQVDMRFPPGFEVAQLRGEMRERAGAALATPGCRLEFHDLFDGIPAFATPADSALVKACESLTGYSAAAVDFATEGPFFNRLGLETVILGPGDIEVAHKPDEFLPLARIEPMMQTLRGLVQRFCL